MPYRINPHTPADSAIDGLRRRMGPRAHGPALVVQPLMAVEVPHAARRRSALQWQMLAVPMALVGTGITYGLYQMLGHAQDQVDPRMRPIDQQISYQLNSLIFLMAVISVWTVQGILVTCLADRLNGPSPSESLLPGDFGRALDGPDGRRLPGSEQFERWILRLSESADYADPATRPHVQARAAEVVQAMHDHPPLRALCIAVAANFQTCGDAVASGLDQLQDAIALARLVNQNGDGARIAELGVSCIARDLVRSQVRSLIPDDQSEAIESMMLYERLLNDELGLDLATRSMIFPRLGQASQESVAQVAQRVHQVLEDPVAMRALMVGWNPLRAYVGREFAADLRSMELDYEAEVRSLDDRDASTMGEYQAALARYTGMRDAFIDERAWNIVGPHMEEPLRLRLPAP